MKKIILNILICTIVFAEADSNTTSKQNIGTSEILTVVLFPIAVVGYIGTAVGAGIGYTVNSSKNAIKDLFVPSDNINIDKNSTND